MKTPGDNNLSRSLYSTLTVNTFHVRIQQHRPQRLAVESLLHCPHIKRCNFAVDVRPSLYLQVALDAALVDGLPVIRGSEKPTPRVVDSEVLLGGAGLNSEKSRCAETRGMPKNARDLFRCLAAELNRCDIQYLSGCVQ